jgi:hypothetical protein
VKKPKGFGAFDALARKVASVPKTEVDKKIAVERHARKRRKKK